MENAGIEPVPTVVNTEGGHQVIPHSVVKATYISVKTA